MSTNRIYYNISWLIIWNEVPILKVDYTSYELKKISADARKFKIAQYRPVKQMCWYYVNYIGIYKKTAAAGSAVEITFIVLMRTLLIIL